MFKNFLPFFIILIIARVLIARDVFAQITPVEAVELMQKGINMGNTLEPPNEGDWGNTAQEYYFDMYKAAGFACVRVPVRWDEHIANYSSKIIPDNFPVLDSILSTEF